MAKDETPRLALRRVIRRGEIHLILISIWFFLSKGSFQSGKCNLYSNVMQIWYTLDKNKQLSNYISCLICINLDVVFLRHTCRRNCKPLRETIHTSYIKETGVKNIGISVQGFRLDWKHFYIQVPNIHVFIVSRNVILLMTAVNFETRKNMEKVVFLDCEKLVAKWQQFSKL